MRTVVITGGNTGIGFETAAALANQGFKTIIACRDAAKGHAAVEKLKYKTVGSIETRVLDLADFTSIRQFAQRLVRERVRIDVLVNNAGVMACPPLKTKDGLELQLGVNHFGHFLLTRMLYPLMKGHDTEARIVNLSSSAHLSSPGINFDDINSEKAYSKWAAYGQSKLANVLFTYELARRIPREDRITANAVHPGIVATELGRYLVPETSNFFWKGLFSFVTWFFKTPAQGAETSIYVASSPDLDGISGKYYVDCKETRTNGASYSEEMAEKLWQVSNDITQAQWEIERCL